MTSGYVSHWQPRVVFLNLVSMCIFGVFWCIDYISISIACATLFTLKLFNDSRASNQLLLDWLPLLQTRNLGSISLLVGWYHSLCGVWAQNSSVLFASAILRATECSLRCSLLGLQPQGYFCHRNDVLSNSAVHAATNQRAQFWILVSSWREFGKYPVYSPTISLGTRGNIAISSTAT